MKNFNLITSDWADYELLDSGENMKLERFGKVIISRPETQSVWAKARPEIWKNAHATFTFRDKKDSWSIKKEIPEEWVVAWGEVRAQAKLTAFKHTGIFPEQMPNWEWIDARVKGFVNPSSDEGFTKPFILNLFGYTGMASIVAAQAGAFVTHVDASKQSLDWAHENAQLSALDKESVRWILDDALSFAKREVRRGAKYDGIILDPPAFGRGAKGEVWKIEEQLPELLDTLNLLLSDKAGSFLLLSGYAAGYSPISFKQVIESAFGKISGINNGEYGELHIKESASDRVIPAGIYVRFIK